MSDDLIMCGVLVHAVPGKADGLVRDLNSLPGTEVHHRTDDGRLIVTLESEDSRQAGDILLQIQSLSGVAAASLVYHHFEQIDGPGSVSASDPGQFQEMKHETEQA